MSTCTSSTLASGPIKGMKATTIEHATNAIRIRIQMPGCFLNNVKASAIHSQPRPASTARPAAENATAGAAGAAGDGAGWYGFGSLMAALLVMVVGMRVTGDWPIVVQSQRHDKS